MRMMPFRGRAVLLVATITASSRLFAACPPVLTVAQHMSDTVTGALLTSAGPGMQVRFTITVTNSTSDTATNVLVVDTLSTTLATITAEDHPAGWAADLSVSGTGTLLVAQFGKMEMVPGEKALFTIDALFGSPSPDCGQWSWANIVSASNTGYCAGQRVSSLSDRIGQSGLGDYLLVIEVYGSEGVVWRAVPRDFVCKMPGDLEITYTATGDCRTSFSNPSAPFSPDGDCSNDMAVFVWNGAPYPAVWWDGRDIGGNIVPCGTYRVDATVNGELIDSETLSVCSRLSDGQLPAGAVKVVGGIRGYVDPKRGEQSTIMVKPKDAGDIRVRIFDQSGRLVNELQTSAVGGAAEVLHWDARDSSGSVVAPGLYPIHVSAPGIDYRDTIAVVR